VTEQDFLGGGTPIKQSERKCRDGGACHHRCDTISIKCYREESCAPFSDYTGPWGSDDYVDGEMVDRIEIEVAEGKYTFVYEPGKDLSCLRHGEPWIAEMQNGSNAIVALIHHCDEIKKWNREMQEAIADFPSLMGPSHEVPWQEYVRAYERLKAAIKGRS